MHVTQCRNKNVINNDLLIVVYFDAVDFSSSCFYLFPRILFTFKDIPNDILQNYPKGLWNKPI